MAISGAGLRVDPSTTARFHGTFSGSAGKISLSEEVTPAAAAPPKEEILACFFATAAETLSSTDSLKSDHHTYLGSHFVDSGVTFRVFAPDANKVQVSIKKEGKDFKTYDMILNDKGTWEVHVPGLKEASYQYLLTTKSGHIYRKADPFAMQSKRCEDPFFQHESVIDSVNPAFWGDDGWLETRPVVQGPDAPISIYSVHSLHWTKVSCGQTPSYAKLGELLASHCEANGFTHIQIEDLLDCINPLDSDTCWNFFTPSRRMGPLRQLQEMIDILHKAGIGVIMRMPFDKFDSKEFGLSCFDGHPLFHREGEFNRFDFSSRFAKEYLASAVDFWINVMHIDGFVFNTDGITSSPTPCGSDIKNSLGRYTDPAGARFIKELVDHTHAKDPGVLMIAEGSLPTDTGFDYTMLAKLQMHDDPKAICNLSSIKPKEKDGAEANYYRMQLCRMFFLPGIKNISMGEEFGQSEHWKMRLPRALCEILTTSVDWDKAKSEPYASIGRLTQALNEFYASHPALAPTASIAIHPTASADLECFERMDADYKESLLCFCNISSEEKEIRTADALTLEGYELCFTSSGDSSFVKEESDPKTLGKIAAGSMLVFRKCVD